MRLSIISFTEQGIRLSRRIAKSLREKEIILFTKHKNNEIKEEDPTVFYVKIPVGEWTGEQMQEGNALLFIGACGIAVRSVAPYLMDKLWDVPVLVMDEKGTYVIPILSGHVGGANALARHLAEKTGAEAVITTATDIHGKFAADLFAQENGLSIVNREGIARVSAKALEGKEIIMSVEAGDENVSPESGIPGFSGLPEEICLVPYPPAFPVDIVVAAGPGAYGTALWLRPREYVIGMGCKKGKKAEEIEAFILRKTEEAGISVSQIFALSSISQKQEEPGFLQWCRKERIPFLTYTAEELKGVKGHFRSSAFVEKKTGVDNVCERAALKACGPGGRLICPKCAENGMTLAIGQRRWEGKFYGK